MAPLISIGRRRQIHETDVWFLGFEFQHQRLHEKFRQLKGSVLGRLLRANGIDVFITGTIALVKLICGMHQQYTSAMTGADGLQTSLHRCSCNNCSK
jgi:hypothetical protein